MIYKSKIDWWLAVILIAAMVLCIRAGVMILLKESSAIWWLILPIIGAGLPLWVMLGTKYSIDSLYLYVKSGPFQWKIPIKGITGITRTSNPLSSPALSLDRLRIDYGHGGTVMVSPLNKEQFIRDIEKLAGRSFDMAALECSG